MSVDLVPICERFDRLVMPEPNSGCWLWIGAVVPDGYGSMYWGGGGRTTLKAHRASWILHVGPLNDEQHVLHRCDTPACVNPDHLFLGTNADNVADRCIKGRSARIRGSQQGRSKLTEDDAAVIFLDPRPYAEIAKDFAISKGPVAAIKAGKLWTHVTGGLRTALGRPQGERCTFARLTERDIRSIRSDGRSRRTIARHYGVSASLIDKIIWRKVWAHVAD